MKYSNKFSFLFAAIAIACCSLLNNSCSDNVITVPSDIKLPDSNVSYVYHVEPLMKFTCAAGGCHNAFDRKAEVVLDTYYDLTTALSGAMVIAGKPEQSVLIQIIEKKLPHSLLIDFRINSDQLNGLKAWIREGMKM